MKKTNKYEEGRAAALERLQRLLCGRGEVSSEVTFFVLREEAAWWRRLLLHHLDADTPALSWLAYSRGGLDVVESVWAEHVKSGQTPVRLAAVKSVMNFVASNKAPTVRERVKRKARASIHPLPHGRGSDKNS